MGSSTPTAAILLALTLGAAPQSAPEYDLTWKLPHDRAALYDVYDAAKGTKTGEFCLLACELETRVGAIQGSDLPYRFLFRLPRKKVKVGEQWEVKEFAFGDAPVFHPGVSPVQVTGSYRLKQIVKLRLEDHFKGVRTRKVRTDPVLCALIEGHFEMCRCNWVQEKILLAEQNASTHLTTHLVLRLSDGAILGGRYHLSGRAENYAGAWSGPAVTKVSESSDLVLVEPLVELDKTGMKDRIAKAVEAGVKWLRRQQSLDGCVTDKQGYGVGTSFGAGATGLSLLALSNSDVPSDDPFLKKGHTFLANKRINMAYDLAIHLMALEGKYLRAGTIEAVENWSEDKARGEVAARISREDLELAKLSAKRLIENQGEIGAFGYAKSGDYPNLSSTQYAILGLKSASRMGVAIPSSVWRNTLNYISKHICETALDVTVRVEWRSGEQQEHRCRALGWPYLLPVRTPPTGTMTAAALAILSVCKSELVRSKEWLEQDNQLLGSWSWGAMGWLQNLYSVRSGTPEGCGYAAATPYYYLYGIERAFLLSDVQRIGGHSWYFEGAALLLSWQREDGRWESQHGTPVLDTAFALLYLKRATIPVETPRPPVATGAPAKRE